MHRGAGAYEAGEETALIESLEGKRAQPRIKPPFPAVEGLYGCPTAVNNVETLCNVPSIVAQGRGVVCRARAREKRRAEAVLRQRPRRQARRLRGVDAHDVESLIYDYAGGIANGRQLKAVIPGGISVPILLPDQIDVPASFDGVMKAGSLLGSAGMIVMDDTTCMVWVAKNLLHFYRHETCGKCTPCREGGDWLLKMLGKIERGEGQMRGYRSAAQRRGQHRGQDAVRVRRRRGDARADDDQAVPARVRSAHPRGPVHVPGRVARESRLGRMSDARRTFAVARLGGPPQL